VETVAPPTTTKLPATFIGAITWSGKDSEPGEDNKDFPTMGRKLEGTVAAGPSFDVIANMVPVTFKERQRHLYRVDFTPVQEVRRRRRFLLLEALKDCKTAIAYDGDHLVYCPQLILNKKELEIPAQCFVKREEPPETVLVKLSWADHQKAVLDKKSVMFFCTRFKEAMAAQKDRISIGSDYFDLAKAQQVPEHKCILAPGMSQTVYVTQCGPVLNVDLMFKHIRTDTVWDLMQQMQTRPGWQVAIEVAFSHKSVLISYSDPKKSVIIDKVRMDLSPQSTFDLKGTKTTYADYVKSKYGLASPDLDKKQPLLENVSRTKRDKDGKPVVTHFIPSLCNLTGQTEDMKNDRFRCRELIKLTAVAPGARLTRIQTALTGMVQSEGFHRAFDPWGIEMVPKLLRFPARRLPSPLLRNATERIPIQDDCQSWQVKGKFDSFQKASCFDKWAVLTFQMTNEVDELIRNLMAIGVRDMGIPMTQPEVFNTKGSKRPQDFKEIIEKKIKELKPNFLVVVIPFATDEPYKTVKQMLGHIGVPSQFVTNKALEKDSWTKAIMIMIQMNCKGGGAPWTADLKFHASTPTMIVGLDIHHGGDLEHKGGSVAGYVASLNRECTHYFSRTFLVKPKQQEFEKLSPDGHGLKELTVEAIKRFKATNKNAAPKVLVVYRDGGSEGELARICKYEVAQFQAAFKDTGIECKLAFIVVLKKIRTRFFMVNPSNDKEVSNPPPGTIIDRFITNALLPEFLLCCQHVNQGSATPTKYQLLHDDTGLSGDTLEMYTYCLSHLYFNWPGTIRVPAPVKYASTIAKFVGQILRGVEVNEILWERLHYL